MAKRSLDVEDEEKIQRCMRVRGASERAVHEMWNIIMEQDKQLSRGAFLRAVERELGPWKDKAFFVQFDSWEETNVALPILSLQPLLQKVCSESQAFGDALRAALQVKPHLTPILMCDEATAGNVLSNDKAKKANIYYLSWVEMGHLLKNQNMWLPIAAVQSSCLHTIKGGASAVVVAILKYIVNEESQSGFVVQTPNQEAFRFKQNCNAHFLGDNEGIRGVYSSKGSGGFRPCLHCKNVVKKDAGVSQYDHFFVEISAASGFCQTTDAEIFKAADDLGVAQTKKQLELKEMCCGITLTPGSLLFSDQRTKLPPSRIVHDLMHTYYTNGVASWEVALFCDLVFKQTNVTLEVLQECVLAADWHRHRTDGSCVSQGSTQRLFHAKLFDENLYKGTAKQTSAIAPLLRYYSETTFALSEQMPKEAIASFSALCDILTFIKELQYDLKPVNRVRVEKLQQL